MFTWQRVAAERARPSDQRQATQDTRNTVGAASPRPAPPFWTAFQREQRLATELLRVHALSSALTYEPHAPLRVDAAQWWQEIKQQSVAAVGQRMSRKRRLRQSSTPLPSTAVKPSPVLTGTTRTTAATKAETETAMEPETEDVDMQQQFIHDLLVDALVRILQSLSAWTDATEREDRDRPQLDLLQAVEDAIGDVGVQLLDEWWHAPTLEIEDTSAAQTAAAQIVNVLLQLDDRVGSFHAFHDHKLCASTAQRLFRTTPQWECSKCARSWETHGAAVPILVFHCAVCEFTLCRECFTRIPNSTAELQEIALRREVFKLPAPLHTQQFLPLALHKAVTRDKPLFASLAPQLAIAARGRLQDLLLYRSQEMVPMMQIVLDLFAVRGFPRAIIESEPQLWLPIYISSAKLRLYSFLGPLMWWTSMSDEPGEINLTQEGHRDGTSTALTLQWHEGYQQLRGMLHRLFDCILSNPTQDPFVVDAWLSYLATIIVCFQVTRSSGQNSDDLYDGILINMSSALVHVISPVLESRSQVLQTLYHESYVPQRVYHSRVEPLRSPPVDEEPALRAADDRRVQQADTNRNNASRKEFYYPPNTQHFGVLCDFCHGADFIGLRFKCAVCDDADICANCFEDFVTRPIISPAQQEIEKAQCGDEFHCTDHVFLRLDVPVPLIAANHYQPVEFQKAKLLYSGEKDADGVLDTAESIARELQCVQCEAHLDSFDVIYRCSNCLDPRLLCPACLVDEESHHDPNCMHLPGHLYLALPRPWRQHFNPRRPGLYSRALMYPACIYPRERFNTETEVLYMTIETLHIGPLHSLSKVLSIVKEMYELRSFCDCEEQRVEREKTLARASGRRSPKLSAHYAASQTRLADLGATRLMAEMHLLEASNVVAWITFYSRSSRWLLELASPTQNAFKTLLTDFSNAFSAFPQHFFFDLCDMVHVLTLDGTSSTSSTSGHSIGGIDYQHVMAKDTAANQLALLEPLLVMLVQLLATRECTKNPHLRVHAAKALSSLVSFYAKNNILLGALRKVFQRCVVLREFAVVAVLQFHEDMEGYHIRNNGLVFNNNAGNGDHLLWGFVSIRMTTVLLLRFLWQFADQRDALVRAFRMKSRTPEQTAAVAGDPEVDAVLEAHIAQQVSVLISGLWSDAAKLFEEGNSKVGVLIQLADIRVALQDGRPIQLPFRPSMLEGYIALHSKHLRISMRILVEVLELLSWMADNMALKRALLKPELADQCARTLSFLVSSIATAFQAKTLDFTWHHLADSKRVMAHLVFLVTRCAGTLAGTSEVTSSSSCSPSPCWSLIQESGHAMLRFIGDIEVHNRWTLNRAVVRMESARYLGEDTGEEFELRTSVETRPQSPKDSRRLLLDSDDLDEYDALALLEQQSAEALTTLATQGSSGARGASALSKGQRSRLARQLGNRFVSALAKDGRFDYEGFVAGCDLLLRRNSKAEAANDVDVDFEIVGLSWMTLYRNVLRRCQDMVTLQAVMDELLSDIPEEFLDPLLNTIMTDPVRLPSGNIVDRSVIERHLLTANRVDPFTREPLTVQMLTPCEPLRREIQAYLRTKLQHLENQKEDVLATWGLAWDCIFDGVADVKP